MKKEWVDWFINYVNSNTLKYIYGGVKRELPRSYSYIKVERNQVPFDKELDEYIAGKIGHREYINSGYVLIKYKEGDYIGMHTDYSNDNSVTYCCELQASDCGSKLLVDGVPMEEAVFDSTVNHEVKPINKGIRVSLTVFGKRKRSIKEII